MDADGDFVVTWQSNTQDGSGYGVYGQRYNAAGVAQGSEFRVNTTTTAPQTSPSVALDADGDFIVTWSSNGQDGSGYGVYAQRYNAAGVAQGTEFLVNTFTANNQRFPSAAIDSSGDFVVTWQSNGQDGSSYGIYAQRYAIAPAPNVAPTVNLSGLASADEGQTQSFSFTTTDPDLNTFSIVAISGGAVGTISNLLFNSNTGAGSFDVTFGDGPATSSVSVQIKDSDNALSNLATVDVDVGVVRRFDRGLPLRVFHNWRFFRDHLQQRQQHQYHSRFHWRKCR
jgi:hypothetical protein